MPPNPKHPRFVLFGGLRIDTGGEPLSGRAAQKKRLGTLAVLAVSYPSEMTREALATLLWPESPPERSRRRLASTVYELRQALGPVISEEAGGGLRYDPSVLPCDVVEFAQARERGDLEGAIDLYRGPFLDGVHLNGGAEFERWAETQRDRYARSFGAALEALAEQRAAAADLVGAAEAWRRLAAHEPYNSRIVVRLMHALEAAGDRAGAILHAEEHAARLREELEVEPDPEVQELAERLHAEPVNGGTFLADQAYGVRAAAPAASPPAAHGAPRPGGQDYAATRAAAPDRRRAHGSITPRLALLAGTVAVTAVAGALVYPAVENRRAEPDLVADRVLVTELRPTTADPSLERLAVLATRTVGEALAEIELGEMVVPALRAEAGRRADASDLRAAVRRGQEHGAATVVAGEVRVEASGPVLELQVVDVVERRLALRLDPILLDPADPAAGLEPLRDELAGAIAFRIDPRLSAFPRSRRSPSTFSVYRALVGGMEQLRSAAELNIAVATFQQAAELDSTFMLSHILRLEARYRSETLFAHALFPALTALHEEVTALANRRGDMDPWERALLDYYAALGRHNPIDAYHAARTAAAIAPQSFSAWLHGVTAARLLRLEEAAEALERVGPDDPWVRIDRSYFVLLGDIYHLLGRYEDELRISRLGREQGDNNLLVRNELRARLAGGELDAVVAEIRSELTSPGRLTYGKANWVAAEAARHGQPLIAAELRRLVLGSLEALPEHEQEAVPHRLARTFALLGLHRYEEALPLLRRLVEDHEHLPPYLHYVGLLGGAAARLGLHDEVEDARDLIWERIGHPEKVTMGRADHRALLALARIAAMQDNHTHAAYLVEQARRTQRGRSLMFETQVHMDDAFDAALTAHPTLHVLVGPNPEALATAESLRLGS